MGVRVYVFVCVCMCLYGCMYVYVCACVRVYGGGGMRCCVDLTSSSWIAPNIDSRPPFKSGGNMMVAL